jgi:hypothetical protein
MWEPKDWKVRLLNSLQLHLEQHKGQKWMQDFLTEKTALPCCFSFLVLEEKKKKKRKNMTWKTQIKEVKPILHTKKYSGWKSLIHFLTSVSKTEKSMVKITQGPIYQKFWV